MAESVSIIGENEKSSKSTKATSSNARIKQAFDNNVKAHVDETKFSPFKSGKAENDLSRDVNLPGSAKTNGDVKGVSDSEAQDREELIDDSVSSANAHAIPWEQIVHLLGTSAENGLSENQAALRLNQYGKNKLVEKPPEPLWRKVFRQINNILIYILLIAAIIAAVFQEFAEFGLILGVVVINMTIGLVQEGKAERATAALKAMLSSKATVIRDGIRREVAAETIVPGDLVFIESGNKVPADLRIIQVSNLAIQEALLTGESNPVNKKIQTLNLKLGLGDRKNMAFSATNVSKGQGMGIVVATGDETEIGKINMSVSDVIEEKSQLLKQVDCFGVFIGLCVIPVAVGSFLLAYFRPSSKQYDLAYAFIEAVAIGVAIIPEGLPAIITITLSLGATHMARRHAIVKTLPAVETLGSVMVICSDKTGTLTKNEMTVVARGLPPSFIRYLELDMIVPEE